MRYLTLDFETYFDQDYSLKKISPLEYIRDERFHVHGCAIKWRGEPALWLEGEEFHRFTEATDWTQVTIVGHNLNFDLVVLYEHYGISPARRVDTLGLCRALLPRGIDFDLDNVAKLLGLPGKTGGGAALQAVKGVRYPDRAQLDALGEYARGDVENTEGLFELLWPHLPETERDVMDLVLRMSTEGILEVDHSQLDRTLTAMLDARRAKREACGLSAEVLRSRDKVAQALRDRGVEPPMKVSKSTGKKTYAFAKTDPDFILLKGHPKVGAIVDARIAHASNNAVSRIERIKRITSRWPHTLPVYLNYNGAGTGRLSGGGQLNAQNFDARGPGAGLRRAIRAPRNHVIVVNDLSGIELRLNMWWSGQHDVLEIIRQGGDVYIVEAARQFGIPPNQIDKHTPEGNKKRQFGKVVQLGCGFGLGAKTFRVQCAAGMMGNDPIYLSELEAHQAIQTYRAGHPHVKGSWDWLQHIALPAMLDKNAKLERGPITIEHEAMRLPSGLTISYPNLTASEDGWSWGLNGEVNYIYGGLLQNNAVQGMAGCIIKKHMVEIQRELERHAWFAWVVHQVHDEILVVCPESVAHQVMQLKQEIMSRSPDWAPDLPLAVEGGYDYVYSK